MWARTATLELMRRVTSLGGLILVVGLTACAAPTMEIRSEYDRQALPDFGRYRTYTWLPQPGGSDPLPGAPIVGPHITRAVQETLQAKGYRQEGGAPDFLIGWHAAIQGKQQITRIDVTPGYSQPGGRVPGGPLQTQTMPVVREYDEGTLVLDIVDSRSGKLVWRGWAQAEVRATTDAAQREARIKEAVRMILDRFPPKP